MSEFLQYWFLQISILAVQDSTILMWPAKELKDFLRTRPFMRVLFSNILGRDITHKLYQVRSVTALISLSSEIKFLRMGY